MKQAKPSEAEQDAVFAFLQGLESLIDGVHPDREDDYDEITDAEFVRWVERNWQEIEASWQRVFWAGRTAINNACDPHLDWLEFKPEIREALSAKGEQ